MLAYLVVSVLLAISLSLSSQGYAQVEIAPSWSVRFANPEGSDSTKVVATDLDSLGNTYVAIELRDTIYVNDEEIPPPQGMEGIAVLRLNTSGELVWVRVVPVTKANIKQFRCISVDSCWIWCTVKDGFLDSTFQYSWRNVILQITPREHVNSYVYPQLDVALLDIRSLQTDRLSIGAYYEDAEFFGLRLKQKGTHYDYYRDRYENDVNVFVALQDNQGSILWSHTITATDLAGIQVNEKAATIAVRLTHQGAPSIDSLEEYGIYDHLVILNCDLRTGKINWVQTAGGKGIVVQSAALTEYAGQHFLAGLVSGHHFGFRNADTIFAVEKENPKKSFIVSIDSTGKVTNQRLLPGEFEPRDISITQKGITLLGGGTSYYEIDSLWCQPRCDWEWQTIELSHTLKASRVSRASNLFNNSPYLYTDVAKARLSDDGTRVVMWTSFPRLSPDFAQVRSLDIAIPLLNGWEQIGKGFGNGILLWSDEDQVIGREDQFNRPFRKSWLSTNHGTSWELSAGAYGAVELMPFDGARWYAYSGNDTLKISTDSGRSFRSFNMSDTLYVDGYRMVSHDGRIFAPSNRGLAILHDTTWQIDNASSDLKGGTVFSRDSFLFFAGLFNDECKLYRRASISEMWEEIQSIPRSEECHCSSDPYGIWLTNDFYFTQMLSVDNGVSWVDTTHDAIYARDAQGGDLFALSGATVYKRDTVSKSWDRVTDSIPTCNRTYNSFLVDQKYFYVTSNTGDFNAGVFRWSRSGRSTVEKGSIAIRALVRITGIFEKAVSLEVYDGEDTQIELYDVLGSKLKDFGMLRRGASYVLNFPREVKVVYLRAMSTDMLQTIPIRMP